MKGAIPVECPSCHSEMPKGSRFCDRCGAALAGCCPSCGASTRPDARFCSNCGTSLMSDGGAKPATIAPPALSAAAAERRQLTVMFCDLVGSTALSARLDPEDMREIIRGYHRCCAEETVKAGGFVAKFMGDGVLAYFGYPQAHEDDAERAVRVALALVEAVRELPTAQDAQLQVRIGISTGVVVVGDLFGEGAAREQGVVGDTPNLAARLQALAAPGQVVISQSTRRLSSGHFEYRDLGRVALKGIADPVQAWQVLRASAVESRFEAQHETSLTPLVGREEELELLTRRWQGATSGRGSVVLLSGEPGIGKSRLAQAVLERLAAEPSTRLRYFCSPHHQDTALYPTIARLERVAGFRRDDTDHQRLDKLEAFLAKATGDLGDSVPLLAELLSIPTLGRYPPLNLTPQKHKEKLLQVLIDQVEGLARRNPVLVVVEDVHWADPTSLEVLDLVIDRIPTLPILIIITFRPEFAPPWLGRPHVTMLSLNRLPLGQTAEVIAGVTAGKALPKEIVDEIVNRTDGIPLFIEELTKAVVESGELMDAGDRYTVAGSLPPVSIPMTLHASLLARLDRLGPAREVAQIGAALGRQFSHELISAVAAMPQLRLDDDLAELASAELIYRRGNPPDAEYTFKHALVQDAAYGTLLRSRRQQLHARIVATLERQFPEIVISQPQLVAQHCAAAGLDAKAVDYRLKAGRQAMARSEMPEAEAHLRKGLDLLAGLPEDTERQERELKLQIALARTLVATQGHAAPEVAETQARARRLWDELGQPPQSATADLALANQFEYRLTRAELALARREAAEVLERGNVRNDPLWTVAGCNMSATVSFFLGEFSASCAYAKHSLELYDPEERDLRRRGSVGSIYQQTVARSYGFLSLFHLGYLDQARRQCEEAQAGARAHAFSRALALACGLYLQSEPDLLLRRCQEMEAHCADHGFPIFGALATTLRGSALSALGRTEEGLALLMQGLAVYRGTGAALQVPRFLAELADAYGKGGRPLEGLKCLDEAARQVEQTQERWAEAHMLRVRGELLAAVGEYAAAEAGFRQAIAVARRQKAKLWELRAARSLSRLWREQGRHEEARDLLAPIYGWFTEGFDAPDLGEAKLLLTELA
jgi:class 3 adenylate cyclase/predicted ATPase